MSARGESLRVALHFYNNQDDVDRRHLWSVPVDGGRSKAVTSGAGIEWSPVPTDGGRALAFLRSDTRRPARLAIKIGSQSARDLAPEAIPANFPVVTDRPVPSVVRPSPGKANLSTVST